MKRTILILALLAPIAASSTSLAQTAVPWWTVDAGGGKSTSANNQYTLSGTIAQHDAQAAATSANGRYALKSGYWVPYIPPHGPCGTADFNNDGDTGTDQDIEAFFACLAGICCPTCQSADFDGDGDTGTDFDIEAFFRVLSGGSC